MILYLKMDNNEIIGKSSTLSIVSAGLGCLVLCANILFRNLDVILLSTVPALTAFILGIISLNRTNKNRGKQKFAIIGIVTGAIIPLLIVIALFRIVFRIDL